MAQGIKSVSSLSNVKATENSPEDHRRHHHALIGSIVHSIKFGELEVINDGAIIYSTEDGSIQEVIDFSAMEHGESPETLLAHIDKANIIDCTGKFIIPGFVDAHCHAPQV